METVSTPEERERILQRIAERLGIPAEVVNVPYQGDRLARPGEKCTCGQEAIVVYTNTRYGTLGYCGGRHG